MAAGAGDVATRAALNLKQRAPEKCPSTIKLFIRIGDDVGVIPAPPAPTTSLLEPDDLFSIAQEA